GSVALEQGRRAAVVADLLVGPLDHPVTLASLGVEHLAGSGDLEALFGARLRLDLGHFSSSMVASARIAPLRFFASSRLSLGEAKYDRHGSPYQPGDRRPGI